MPSGDELELDAEIIDEPAPVSATTLPGTSGVKRAARSHIREQAQRYTQVALTALVEVASDVEQPGSARVSAATALLDRGYGRPEQSHKLEAGSSIIDLLREMNRIASERSAPRVIENVVDVSGECDGEVSGEEDGAVS